MEVKSVEFNMMAIPNYLASEIENVTIPVPRLNSKMLVEI